MQAGVELAAEGGPDAVVLREAARRVGVSATAAYRHFEGQQALLEAVKHAALERLAERMRDSLEGLPSPDGPAGPAQDATAAEALRAIARLQALGRAYFRFAMESPGLFRCFCIGLPMPEGFAFGPDDDAAFGVLSQVLDELVATGTTLLAGRPASDIVSWAAVHGLATLCLDGPLAQLDPDEQEGLLQATLGMILGGLLDR